MLLYVPALSILTLGLRACPVPTDIIIPAGETSTFSGEIKTNTITVNGIYKCENSPTAVHSITANRIIVGPTGQFICGESLEAPFLGKLTVTLTGNTALASDFEEERSFAVLDGGIVRLHGLPTTSWLELAGGGAKGSTSLTLSETPLNWKVGSEIAITSTNLDANQYQVVKITAINSNVVGIDTPLAIPRMSALQTYYPPWKKEGVVLNERAELIMLNRNILIQGPENAGADYFRTKIAVGGHFKVGGSDVLKNPNATLSKAFIANVEFKRMGKTGYKGRYPLHLHFLREAGGQYVRNVSVRNSFHRCFATHATSNMLFKDNSCFFHFGHGFYMEDGSEINNIYDHNIVAVSKKIDVSVASIATESNNELSSFWYVDFLI